MINVDGGYPVQGRIYFPTAGYRDYNGNVYTSTSQADLCTTSPGTYNTTGYTYLFTSFYALYIRQSSTSYTHAQRGYSYPARCISDPYDSFNVQ
jgi:hypothetical protein